MVDVHWRGQMRRERTSYLFLQEFFLKVISNYFQVLQSRLHVFSGWFQWHCKINDGLKAILDALEDVLWEILIWVSMEFFAFLLHAATCNEVWIPASLRSTLDDCSFCNVEVLICDSVCWVWLFLLWASGDRIPAAAFLTEMAIFSWSKGALVPIVMII